MWSTIGLLFFVGRFLQIKYLKQSIFMIFKYLMVKSLIYIACTLADVTMIHLSIDICYWLFISKFSNLLAEVF